MGIYRKGNIYWFIKQHGGRRYEESLGTSIKRLAEEIYASKLQAILKGEYDKPEIRSYTFRELAEKYLEYKRTRLRSRRSIDKESRAIALLTVNISDREVNSIATQEVEQMLSRMLENNKPATVNRKFDVFRHMFTKAADWDMISEDALKRIRRVKKFKVNNRRLRYLSGEECQKLISYCDPHAKPIVITALNTGMRKGEILSLKWEQVDLKHGFILLDKTKSGERREIPINETVRATLQGLARRLDVPYVFYDLATGKPYNDIKRGFHSAMRKAGIKDFVFHDLRHTFASHLIMAGVDITTVSKLLGHRSLTMTLRYSHLAPAHLAEAVHKLKNYYNSTTISGASKETRSCKC